MCPNKYWTRSQHSKLVVECLRYDTSGRPLDIVSVDLCVWNCPQMGSKHLQSGQPLQRYIQECPSMYCSSPQGPKLLAACLRYDMSGRPLDSVSVHLCVWKCLRMDSKGLQSGRPLQRCIHKCPSMYCSSPQGSKLVAARLRYDTSS